QVDGGTDAHGLRVRANGGGGAVGVDDVAGHGILRSKAARSLPDHLSDPLHGQYHLEPAHAPHHFRHVLAVTHLDLEADRRDIGVALDVFEAVDVRFGFSNRGGHLGQRAGPVVEFDAHRGGEIAADFAVPADRDPTIGRLAVLGDIGAVEPVHDDALAGGVVPHDLVAGDRQAALGEADDAAFGAGDEDLVLAARHRLRDDAALGLGRGLPRQ